MPCASTSRPWRCKEPFHARVDAVAGRQDQHWRGVAALAQFRQQRQAVAVGQPQIEQNQIELPALQGLTCLRMVREHIDGVAQRGERLLQRARDQGIIFDDEQAHTTNVSCGRTYDDRLMKGYLPSIDTRHPWR